MVYMPRTSATGFWGATDGAPPMLVSKEGIEALSSKPVVTKTTSTRGHLGTLFAGSQMAMSTRRLERELQERQHL